MGKTQRVIWEIYFLFVLIFTLRAGYALFDPRSEVYLYYRILTAFEPLLQWMYWCAVVRIMLGIIQLVPLALFISGIKLWHPLIWQAFFILRLVFEFTGHSYELNIFISLWHHDPQIAVAVFLSAVAIYVPAAIAQFFYAFMPSRLNLKEI